MKTVIRITIPSISILIGFFVLFSGATPATLLAVAIFLTSFVLLTEYLIQSSATNHSWMDEVNSVKRPEQSPISDKQAA